jgi:hypothetical protein
MKKKLLLICLCIAVGTTAQIDITKVKADIVSDGGSDSIGGETAGDNDGVIVGDGDQQPDTQPAPQPASQPVPVQPPQEAETPAASQPVKSSQSKKEPEKTIEPQKTEKPAPPEESEKSAEPAPSKEPEKTENPDPSKEPEKTIEPQKTEKPAPPEESEKSAETIPSKEPVKEKTPAISLKIIKMFGALIIGYIVAAVIVIGFRTVMSPLVFYMSIDMRYRFAAPVRLKKAPEGYQIDITKIIDRYDSSTFQIRFNRMVLKKLQGMELTIINGEQRIASDIRSSIDISI